MDVQSTVWLLEVAYDWMEPSDYDFRPIGVYDSPEAIVKDNPNVEWFLNDTDLMRGRFPKVGQYCATPWPVLSLK